MARAKHTEPLITKAFVITERQQEALEKKATTAERSVSYFVREALDFYLDHPAATLVREDIEPLAATA